jgi:chaperone BCS1
MERLSSLLSPFSSPSAALIDGVKFVVIGSSIETARRVSVSAWSQFVNSFYLTAHFSEEDFPFDWLMHWLSKQPAWGRSREFETTTRTTTAGRSKTAEVYDEDDNEDEDDELAPGKQKLKVVFRPTFDTTHSIWYKGHWLRVKRSKKTDGSDVEVLSISVVARNNSILKQLVLQAKKEYETDAEHRVNIYFADSHGSWRWTDSRHKRPMSSIVLNRGVKEMLLADARDFLKSEKWYADRGIPFRRGYLLYGVPGSGKTSLIHALAGELSLDIYVVSLSASWINDATLTTLMGRVPARCIVLLEDLDAAFTRSVSREDDAKDSKKDSKDSSSRNRDRDFTPSSFLSARDSDRLSDCNTLSLSGLLNSLDGVAAAEGRILFATTNHLEKLDPALSRPGRLDVWLEFKNASCWQAEQLFRNFFPSSEDIEAEGDGPPEGARPPTEEEELAMLAKEQGVVPSSPTASTSTDEKAAVPESLANERNPPKLESMKHDSPLSAAKLASYAQLFASSIPDNEFPVAALQGYLLKNKARPEAAAKEAKQWVLDERALRARLKKEREEREEEARKERERRRKEREEKEKKEKEEKEEKEKKEKEEKEKKEKEEKEKKEKEEKEKKEKEEKEKKEKQEKEKAAKEKAKETTEDDSELANSTIATGDDAKKEKWVDVKKDESTDKESTSS